MVSEEPPEWCPNVSGFSSLSSELIPLRIHLLVGKNCGFYEYCYLPILKYKKHLKLLNIDTKIFTGLDNRVFEADCFVYTSTFNRELNKISNNGEEVTKKTFEILSNANKYCDKVYYFDNSDSTSAYGQFRYLPYVHKYLKPWIYENKNLYMNRFYRDRIFTDYYHKNFNINDDKESPLRYLPEKKELNKIQLAWNTIYSDFSIFSKYRRKIEPIIKTKLPTPVTFISPSKNRNVDISFRGSTNYGKNTLNFQRLRVNEIAKRMGVYTDRTTRKKYLNELRNCKLALSPFGYGEVCFRDFEIIINGAALIKPDMSHMKTWPDIFQPNETYIPFNWNSDNLVEVINDVLISEKWLLVAQKANAFFRHYLNSEKAGELFCKYLLKIFDD